MSSTNRGYERHISDFYITPQEPIRQFLDKFLSIESVDRNSFILDPCAGGNDRYDMPYPTVLSELGFKKIITNDIREDSKAFYKDDFINNICGFFPDLIISNPPFNLALDFITKALDEVTFDGFVDINDISNSLHIDKEYVIEVVKDKYIFVDGSLL